MPDFVRVRLDDVGEWSHPVGHPIPDGAVLLEEPAVDGAGRALPDRPFPAEAAPVEQQPFYAADLAPAPDATAGEPTATAPDGGLASTDAPPPVGAGMGAADQEPAPIPAPSAANTPAAAKKTIKEN